MPDPTPAVSPEPQTIKDCAALREKCQQQVFAHIDSRHSTVMEGIGEIKEALSYEKGRQAGTRNNKPVNNKKFPWREVVAVIAIVTAAIASAIVAVDKIVGEPRATAVEKHAPPE